MSKLNINVPESNCLYLSWMKPFDKEQRRDRRIVGVFFKEGSDYLFKYHSFNGSLEKAIEDGFIGYPAFPMNEVGKEFSNALEIFSRRLPDRSRADFSMLKQAYALDENVEYSDYELLSHLSGRVASDEFELITPFDGIAAGSKLLIEVTAVRRYVENVEGLAVGELVNLVHEPDNPFDKNAIKILRSNGNQIGYINRIQNQNVLSAIASLDTTSEIYRINGNSFHPRVFIFTEFNESDVEKAA